MTVRREMAEWRATSAKSKTRVTCELDDGLRSEVRGFRNFESRFSRQSRPSRLTQASAIAAEVFMNNAGGLTGFG
jgi:hypothetical protein